ncbi:MAG: CHASE3 domain-containing protein [Rhodospirillales bacterium]
MQQQLFGRREKLAFAAGALIMLGIVGASGWLAVQAVRNLTETAHLLEIRTATAELVGAATAAETGQRGYLLTGKANYLAPYASATADVPRLMRLLSTDAAEDPDLPALRRVLEIKMAELARTVDLATSGRRAEALRIVESDQGEIAMEQARSLVERMAEHQRAALAVGIEHSRRRAMVTIGVDVAAFVLLVLLAMVVASGAGRYVRKLRSAQGALLAANDDLASGREFLEVAVRERTAELSGANEDIQRFAYIVSHDLRAPLVNIIGFTNEMEIATQTLQGWFAGGSDAGGAEVSAAARAAVAADMVEAIRFIRTSTSKMERLTATILRLSREGHRYLVPERLDMRALVTGVIGSLRHQADTASAEATVGMVPVITSDRIAVEQIFSSLIENALKYSFPGRRGKISVEGGREGPMAVFTVRDNGRGIAARDLNRVFELFRRSGSQDTQGEGIGLANVRALARRLGGSVQCASTIDVGSEFSVRLPQVLVQTTAESA